MANLEKAKSWSPRVISKLESAMRSAEDEALFRINPMSFAGERNIAETEAVDLFLHAASAGLFMMDWQLLCPQCSCVVESFGAALEMREEIATFNHHRNDREIILKIGLHKARRLL